MIVQRSGAVSGQTIPHFYPQALPRTANDALSFTWPRRNPPADEFATLAEQIRVADGGHQ